MYGVFPLAPGGWSHSSSLIHSFAPCSGNNRGKVTQATRKKPDHPALPQSVFMPLVHTNWGQSRRRRSDTRDGDPGLSVLLPAGLKVRASRSLTPVPPPHSFSTKPFSPPYYSLFLRPLSSRFSYHMILHEHFSRFFLLHYFLMLLNFHYLFNTQCP